MRTHVAVSVIALLVSLVAADKIDSLIPCRDTSNCTNIPGLPRETICQEGYCMCPSKDGFINCSSIQTSIHETRTPGPLLYHICKVDQNCNITGAFCNTTNNQCECSKDYVPSKDRHRCLQKVQSINSSCEDDNQCLAFLANTTCHSKKCICISDYYYTDGACWRKAGYGQPCTKSQECSHIENANCTNDMKCECPAETVLSENGKKCLTAARNFRDKCTESKQCISFENAMCIEKTCQCPEGYHYEYTMTRCFLSKGIDSKCGNTYDCYQAEINNNNSSAKSLICENNKCTCAENYVRLENTCVSRGPSILASFPLILVLIAIIGVNL